MAVAVSAARPYRRRPVVRRSCAVPDSRRADHDALAHGPHDASDPRLAVLDPDGRHGDFRAGGTRLLILPADIPVVRATTEFVSGFAFALWSFGTWWAPLVVIIGVWRHARRHWALTYDPAQWSVVFPLGMYSAALTDGKTTHVGFMEPLARFIFSVAVAAWAAVAAAFLVRLVRDWND
jgi:hypothetical protein